MQGKKRTKTYELFLVFECEASDAERLADAAWLAANGGHSSKTGNVVLAHARERLPDKTLAEVDWPGWQEPAEVDLRASYEQ